MAELYLPSTLRPLFAGLPRHLEIDADTVDAGARVPRGAVARTARPPVRTRPGAAPAHSRLRRPGARDARDCARAALPGRRDRRHQRRVSRGDREVPLSATASGRLGSTNPEFDPGVDLAHGRYEGDDSRGGALRADRGERRARTSAASVPTAPVPSALQAMRGAIRRNRQHRPGTRRFQALARQSCPVHEMPDRASQAWHERGRDTRHAAVLRYPRLDGARGAPAPDRVPRLPRPLLQTSSEAIVAHDGLVDKLVGDEVVSLFFGGISGPNHAAAAVAAAVDLAERAARADAAPTGPIPVGTAVHTGEAFVGGTGPGGTIEDFTALGDVVNTTARLASAARAGEVIVSTAAADAAGAGTDGLERRTVEIRGRVELVEVIVLRPAEVATATGS